MSLIQSPGDAWDALRKRHRLSDTTECRRAFCYGAFAGLEAQDAISGCVGDTQDRIDYEQALERFKRERC